ncbi:MAG: hypothetical protein IJ157_06635 [Clostridia bacterium]|nr:hypothetical protein [Clostridia bacterium]
MDIIETMAKCIIVLGAMRPRVDQPDISDSAKTVIGALNNCGNEAQRMLQEMDDMKKKIERLEAANNKENAQEAADGEDPEGNNTMDDAERMQEGDNNTLGKEKKADAGN